MSAVHVPQKGVKQKMPNFFISLITIPSSFICIVPLMIMDLTVWQFQNIYFRFHDIPILARSDYVQVDRYELSQLGFWQKVNCVYCGYANGVVAFAKDIVNQMEIYSCAIKHAKTPKGQEHHKKFYERSRFK